jgi:glycosyltransferase involved in cell wall biosynthesis
VIPPAASVIIGVYNRARQIGACLESLLASSVQDFEMVLVEDGSADDSGDVLERFKREHPERRIKVIHNPRNRGASGARNVGIEAAEGEVLLFTDSDCVAEPAWIERMIDGFRRTGAAAISGTVLDKEPTNLAERAYVGSCLATRKAPNLMESNMGLRRQLGYRLDEAIFGGEGDDLARRIREDGRTVALVPEAVVHHHHAMGFAGYMRMGRQQGRGHALYWYKHGLFLGRDILSAGLAVITLPLGILDARLLLVPAAFAALQLGAVLFNEVHYKGKSVREALTVLPVQVAYYAVRTISALRTWASIALGREPDIRESRRRWLATRRAA